MVQGQNRIWVGAAGVALAVGFSAAAQQATPAPQQTPVQQQAIPDAPRPQTLPDLRTITPLAPAVNAPDTPQPTSTDGQKTPGGSLPSTPAAAQEDGDVVIPPAGKGPGAFILPSVQVNFVQVPFTVKDSKGQLVPGLQPRDIRVYENNARQQVRFFTVDPFPLSVALVIDQSVTFDTMTKVNNALQAIQGAFTPYDEVAVFTYNNGVKEQTPFTKADGQRLAVILDRSKGKGREPSMAMGGPLAQGTNINGHGVDPNTDGHNGHIGGFEYAEKEFHTLNDAILAAARETSHAKPGRRRIVYVISDGKEYGSTAKEKEVIRYCQTNNVTVYGTLVGESAVPGLGFVDRIHLPFTMRDNALTRYTAATGGETDAEFRQKNIEMSFAKITEAVRTQYTVGYYSHEPIIDGKYRKLEVKVARPNLTIISKEGYYPSIQSSQPTPVTPSATP